MDGITVTVKLRNEEVAKVVYSIKEKGASEDKEKTELNHTFSGLQEGKKYEITIETKNEYGTDSRTYTVSTGEPIPSENSLIGAVRNIQDGEFQKVIVNGKVNGQEEEEITYSMHTIVHKGNLVLNGTNNIAGATLTDNVYEFGDKTTDVGKEDIQKENVTTEIGYAKNMVVLKVEGDLTINQGVTLTTCKRDEGNGGPKGFLIYCTGKLTNNGTISMTARGAKAEVENVYLWENEAGTYEYVPALGANGGSGVCIPSSSTRPGANGNNGYGRETGGRRLWKCDIWRF